MNQIQTPPSTSPERLGDRSRRARAVPRLRLPTALSTWQPAQARDALYRRLLVGADVIAAGVALTLSVAVLGDDRLTWPTLALLPLLVLISKVTGLYDRDELLLRKTTLDEAPALFQLATIYALLTWLLEGVFIEGRLSQPQVLGVWISLFVLLVASRTLFRHAAQRVAPPERCLLLGDQATLLRIEDKLAASAPDVDLLARVAVEMDGGRLLEESDAALASLEEQVHRLAIDRVIVAAGSLDHERTIHIVTRVKGLGVKVSILPRLFEVIGSTVEFDDLGGQTVLSVRRFGLTRSSRAIKRVFDVAGASVLLAGTAPIFLIAAIAIRLDSRGPIFFRQTRIGRDGNPFQILKFRTMEVDAEAKKQGLAGHNETAGLFKIAVDPRITTVGRFLRAASLDELTQLINVLRGEMSLVGPRPLVTNEDKLVVGYHRRRLHITPGITGAWQLQGALRAPLNEMVAMDYLYVASWSLWQDVKILLRTVPHVLLRRGT